jgi:release factor glutamine methyltransferase
MTNGSPEHWVSGLDLWQWREEACAAAIAVGIPPNELDWLLQAVSDLDKLALRLHSFKGRSQIPLTLPWAKLRQLWQQRLEEKVPVQYLVGVTPWRNFQLAVTPAVLIPRPETEYLIELSIAAGKNPPIAVSPPLDCGHWADLGTGSGAIALGLAESFTRAQIHAIERSQAALDIASRNARNLGFADRIAFHLGDWFEPLAPWKGQLSGIVSNPPYIPSHMVGELQPEVTQHEPHLALDGGPDGLDCIRHIVATAPNYLRSGGVLLFEMMAYQAAAVTELLQHQGSYCQIEIFSDLAGIERFARAYRVK